MTTERAGTPGRNWDTELVTAEVVVDTDDGESPFGWREPEPPTPNRETRRAMRRAARRNR
jgi:hypothetical protein